MSGSRDEGGGGLHLTHKRRKDALLGHRSSGTTTRRRIRRTQSDESRRRSVRHTSVCTPTRGGRRTRARTLSREGHLFHVSQAQKNVICSHPRATDLARDGRNHSDGVIAADERNQQLAADPNGRRTPRYAHHWLVRRAWAWSILPRTPAEGRQDVHWENWCFRLYECGCPAEDIDVGARTGLLRGPSHRITENDALIWWLGGLQGRRTTVTGTHQGCQKSYSERDGLLR